MANNIVEEDEEDFEEQLRLEALEAQSKTQSEAIEHGRVRKDSDGTEFEWDADKKAWFPKINEDFIANYQMNYGSNPLDLTPAKKHLTEPPAAVKADPDAYWKYYYGDNPPDTSDPNYPAWYAWYYSKKAARRGKQFEELMAADKARFREATRRQMLAEVSVDEALDAPAKDDPAYAKWYYKRCYGVEPDETIEEYKQWAKALMEAAVVKEGEEAKPVEEEDGKESEEPKAKKAKPEPKWFDQTEEHSTSVYVQGLPDDITEIEFTEMMAKCGLIAYDYEKKKQKIKLYLDKDSGKPKGDGLCTYIKRESVDLAMQLIDESELRGSQIECELAKFELKGQFDPTKRRKPKNNKAKRREKEKQAKLLDWQPDKLPDERFKSEKTVVLRNVFDPAEFDKNPAAIQEIRDDMRQECSKYGEFKKLTIHDRNPDGVITVVFKEFEEADLCISSLNHRWFGGRRILADNWNGKERFEVKETPQQEAERLRKWDAYLAGETSDNTEVPEGQPAELSKIATENKPAQPTNGPSEPAKSANDAPEPSDTTNEAL